MEDYPKDHLEISLEVYRDEVYDKLTEIFRKSYFEEKVLGEYLVEFLEGSVEEFLNEFLEELLKKLVKNTLDELLKESKIKL